MDIFLLVVTGRTPDKAKIFMINRRSKDPLSWQWIVNTLYQVDNTVWQQNGVLSKAKSYRWFVYIVGRHNVLMNASRITPELLHLFVNLQALLGMTMFAIFHLFVGLFRLRCDDIVSEQFQGMWWLFMTKLAKNLVFAKYEERDVVHVINEW